MIKKILVVLVVLMAGIGIGKFIWNNGGGTVMPSPNALYHASSSDGVALRAKLEFTGTIHEVREGDLIMDAVRKAAPGDLIRVYPGTYKETVYIDKDDISFQGIIKEGEWPVLDGSKELNDAFLYSGNGIRIENFKIINYKGNGIMGQAGNNFVLRNNWVIDAGVYGIFPQFGKNGLIEHNILTGIEDAAIYVGMCDNIDVLNNEVFGNVAGIEIENSRHCLVENNLAYNNTGGILAFITPGLPIKTTFDVIIRNNFVTKNNHENFGAPGSIVSGIPPGTGILVMAADDVIIENNIISGNDNAGIIITDFANGGAEASNDPDSEPNPDRITILDNFMIDNGNNPVGELKALMLTQLSSTGPDILAIGGGEGSSIRDIERYRTWGLGDFAVPEITSTSDRKTFLLDKPAEPRQISKEDLGEMTYYGICSGCHAYDIRLIGVPTNVIQMIYKDNPQGMVDYMNNPKNLRDDYPEMPPQDYLSDEAKLAVAEYILTLKK
ncbi:right-handed parallel beta-helix repeat-containing protein [Lutimonas saemankumensis]|uniref:parallel beta-helix domain-containing protein n=1 Tax=Lutimonas saemankumensis TaxID=483016 RepID=UPI001CD3714B|nr:parallel beta-helix domain-containing protein [Lutimonas saemankumensis]MCA0933499.1 right-handed parallel beta-helix repeat-containing protein [Lutimonas saemankumensis]